MPAPTGQWPNKTFFVELIDALNKCIDMGVTTGGTTVSTLLTALATERDAR